MSTGAKLGKPFAGSKLAGPVSEATSTSPSSDSFDAEVLTIDGTNPALSVTKEFTTLLCSTDQNPTLANGGTSVIRKTIWFRSQGSTQVNVLGSFKKYPGGFAYTKILAVLTDGDVQCDIVWLPSSSAWILKAGSSNPGSTGILDLDS